MITVFQKKVFEACRKIPMGRVSTYKLIAEHLQIKGYRAVGNALNKNPFGIINCKTNEMVPCHRVVGSNGHLHGFAHGLDKKSELLKHEGIKIINYKIQDFEKVIFYFFQ